MNGNNRSDIRIGQFVEIVQKQHQRTGELTDGIIKRILTKSKTHPHGIKVMLDTGEVGRVQRIVEDVDDW
jgi:uncharacterized repeat protein (TIGR03833 family)